MNVTIKVEIDGLLQTIDTVLDQLEDLEKPLSIFGAYLRRRSLDRYAEQGFAPLAESTIEARASKGIHSLERKLQGDVRKSLKRARLARGGRRSSFIERALGMGTSLALEDAISAETRGAKNRRAVLAAFQAIHEGSKFKDRVQSTQKLTIKQNIALSQREARAVMRAVNRPILGNLPRTVQWDTDGENVTLRSQTHQEWTEAHNTGATVGHGAVLPKRETIKVEDSDLQVLVAILKHHMLVPFQEGMHGPAF